MAQVGRKETLSKTELLEGIKKHKTQSPTELAKLLNVSRRTIYRRLDGILQEEIEAIFEELADQELKPVQMTFSVFMKIPEMQEYEKILNRKQVSPEYKRNRIKRIFDICKHFKKHPSWITKEHLEPLADLITDLRTGKLKKKGLNYSGCRKSIRSWFQCMRGVSGKLLSAYGIGAGETIGTGKHARERLTQKQRHAFIETLLDLIPDQRETAIIESLVYFLFYTGTRISATLDAEIKDIRKVNAKMWKIRVLDKGLHRKGRLVWTKILIGECLEKIKNNIEARDDIQEGKLFPVTYERVRKLFKEAYERNNIKVSKTCHIWRHTFAQEMLDATNWNYDLVASIGGWISTDTLKKHYGKMGESVREKGLMKACGLPIEIKQKDFKF